MKYLGVDRSRILALNASRHELIALQSAYRPFHDDYRCGDTVIVASEAMADGLLKETDMFWKAF